MTLCARPRISFKMLERSWHLKRYANIIQFFLSSIYQAQQNRVILYAPDISALSFVIDPGANIALLFQKSAAKAKAPVDSDEEVANTVNFRAHTGGNGSSTIDDASTDTRVIPAPIVKIVIQTLSNSLGQMQVDDDGDRTIPRDLHFKKHRATEGASVSCHHCPSGHSVMLCLNQAGDTVSLTPSSYLSGAQIYFISVAQRKVQEEEAPPGFRRERFYPGRRVSFLLHLLPLAS